MFTGSGKILKGMEIMKIKSITALAVICLFISSCNFPVQGYAEGEGIKETSSGKNEPVVVKYSPTGSVVAAAANTATPSPNIIPTTSPTITATTQPVGASITGSSLDAFGPNLDEFPSGVSPLTGLPVSNPANLNLPAVIVSLSNFPPSVRPQTGLSFAPQVYEVYITEGMTRFLTVFYGELPTSYKAPGGDQPARTEPVVSDGQPLLGNRVWLDQNGNGVQDSWEPGVGGVQVDLVSADGTPVSSMVTDANGFFGFTPKTGEQYRLLFHLPDGYQFASKKSGIDAGLNSDADPQDGKTVLFSFSAQDLSWDAGLTSSGSAASTGATAGPTPSSGAVLGSAEQPGDNNPSIEGVRSGREAYVPIVNAFPNGCLIAASKSAVVNVNICKNVYGSDSNNINSAGLPISQLETIAKDNQDPNKPVNYSGNQFAATPPSGGQPANKVEVFYSNLNQAYWQYDAAAQAYMRYEDFGDPNRVGQFQASTDRLTGQPLAFENVVVLFVDHVVRTPTIIDLNMNPGVKGKAIVFRNGQIYQNLYWSMLSQDYEKTTGLERPIRLENADGTPFALSPGNTWYHVATPYSKVWQISPDGVWKYRFYAPAGAKQ